ncbi:hypothetical protein VNI00_017426 [Paramarasmius palmivorus]|uniref:Uncharacterized protein n=1 Tax=Paramarasmius palmivorus TaxID=297713 RepID=A0AAW0B8G6_9AGAR
MEYPFVDVSGSKMLLHFPVRGDPVVVRVSYDGLSRKDFMPFLNSSAGVGGARVPIDRTLVTTVPAMHYVVVSFRQNARNTERINVGLTKRLESLTKGLFRPWYGSMLVDFQFEDVLRGDLHRLVDVVVWHLHMLYERFHPKPLVHFDALRANTSVIGLSHEEYKIQYGGKVECLFR